MMVFRLMDTEIVISEVQKRECLWNPKDENYKNKTDKYKAWEEVSQAVLPKYSLCSEEEKQRIVRAVQSRWKTARDAYMKGRLTELKKPTYRAKSYKYIYQDNLTFLEKVDHRLKYHEYIKNNNSFCGENSASRSTFGASDDDVGEVSDEVMDFDIEIHDDFKEKVKDIVVEEIAAEVGNDKVIIVKEQECLSGTSSQNNDQNDPLAATDIIKPPKKKPRIMRPRRIKSSMSEFETKLLKIMRLKNNTNSSSALQADDQFFFNSLAPLLNNFDMHQKLMFRSKILELVREVGYTPSVNIKQERET